MKRKDLLILAVVVVAAFILWRGFGSQITSTLKQVMQPGATTAPTATPRTAQPATGSQALQQSPAPSNLSTLFPPDVFGPDFLGGLDS
jgi:hypothetical protein